VGFGKMLDFGGEDIDKIELEKLMESEMTVERRRSGEV
jgi:hypothetical protein